MWERYQDSAVKLAVSEGMRDSAIIDYRWWFDYYSVLHIRPAPLGWTQFWSQTLQIKILVVNIGLISVNLHFWKNAPYYVIIQFLGREKPKLKQRNAASNEETELRSCLANILINLQVWLIIYLATAMYSVTLHSK